jgi:DNA-binding IclR family transcriptional regulator
MVQENTNQVLHRAFDLLGVIATYRGQWFHYDEIAIKAGLPKSTTHRLLQFFVERGILERNELVPGAYRYKRA